MSRPAFTVIEITITLCILCVLTAIAMPQAAKLVDRVQLRGAVMDIESAFSGARHLAIARSARSTVEIDTAAREIHVSVNGDIVRTRKIGAEHGVQISASRDRQAERFAPQQWPRVPAAPLAGYRTPARLITTTWP